MAQVKFVIDDQLLKKFKQMVIRKRGKIELTPEGEDAIRLYVEKYRGLIEERSRESEPLADAIGATACTMTEGRCSKPSSRSLSPALDHGLRDAHDKSTR